MNSHTDSEALYELKVLANSGAAVVPANTRDTLTILKSAYGLATKRVTHQPAGAPVIQGYTAGKFFVVSEEPVGDICQLSSVLTVLESSVRALVIRGAPRGANASAHQCRRTLANFQTPILGRRWVLIDLDKIPLPAGTRLPDVAQVREHLISLLPGEFHGASYHWQLSSSAGLGDPGRISMHLWFYFDRRVPDAVLKEWGKWWNDSNGHKIVDTALFNDVQAHYTAAPQFVGMSDPLTVRSGLVRKDLDEVILVLPLPAAIAKAKTAGGGKSLLHTSRGFDAHLQRIGDHAGGDGFHAPIISAIASYIAGTEAENVDIEALYEKVKARVLGADRSQHDDAHVADMASREHILPAITGAIAKYGQDGHVRAKSRQIEGIAPHFAGTRASSAKASAELDKEVDRFFGP